MLLTLALALWQVFDTISLTIKYPEWYGPCTLENENIRLSASFLIFPAGMLLLTVASAFGTYAKIIILEDRFELRALFRRPWTVYYSEINYAGINYWIRKGCKVYYIYFRHDRLPEKYLHKEELGIRDRRSITLSFDEELYEALIYYLPENMSVMLKSSHSYEVVGLFKPKKKKGK